MANDSYTLTGDGSLYLGAARPSGPPDIPAWMPASGDIGNVSLNTMSAVWPTSAPDTRTRGAEALLSSWNSTCYVPTLGELGSIIVAGNGGHADYLGNECYRYDLSTRLWTRLSDPFDIGCSGVQASEVAQYPLTGEYWTDDNKTTVVTGQMCPTHTYGNVVWVPGSIVGNTYGWIVVVGNFAQQCHKFDLDNPTAGWSRFGQPLDTVFSQLPAYGFSLVDTVRQRIACFPSDWYHKFHALSLPGGVVSAQNQGWLHSYYVVGHYAASDDLYIAMSSTATVYPQTLVRIHDPADGALYTPPSNGTTPPDGTTQGSVEWINSKRQLIYWPGSGSTIYIGQAPANPRASAWTWTTRTFGGAAAQSSTSANPLYKRMHYVPQLDAMVIATLTTGHVQAWRF